MGTSQKLPDFEKWCRELLVEFLNDYRNRKLATEKVKEVK